MFPFNRLLKQYREKRELGKYLGRIEYALNCLEKQRFESLTKSENKYKLEIVKWLHAYYRCDSDATSEGPPDVKLAKIYKTEARNITARDHVYASVLFHWIQYKRIEGY